MKLEMTIKFLILFVAVMLFIFPVSAEGSSISSQTVSVTIPELLRSQQIMEIVQ